MAEQKRYNVATITVSIGAPFKKVFEEGGVVDERPEVNIDIGPAIQGGMCHTIVNNVMERTGLATGEGVRVYTQHKESACMVEEEQVEQEREKVTTSL